MKIPAKRLLSLLMVFVMVLGIFPAVMAAEIDGYHSVHVTIHLKSSFCMYRDTESDNS